MENTNNQTDQVEDEKKSPEIPGDDASQQHHDESKAEKSSGAHSHKLGILNNVTVSLTVEIGRAHIKIRDLLNLTKGSIIELNKSAGEPVDVYVNGKLISVGNVITANGKYCVRLTSMPDNEDIEVRQDDQ